MLIIVYIRTESILHFIYICRARLYCNNYAGHHRFLELSKTDYRNCIFETTSCVYDLNYTFIIILGTVCSSTVMFFEKITRAWIQSLATNILVCNGPPEVEISYVNEISESRYLNVCSHSQMSVQKESRWRNSSALRLLEFRPRHKLWSFLL